MFATKNNFFAFSVLLFITAVYFKLITSDIVIYVCYAAFFIYALYLLITQWKDRTTNSKIKFFVIAAVVIAVQILINVLV